MEGMSLPYPRTDSISGVNPGVKYTIGDLEGTSDNPKMSWCLASAYLLGIPLGMSITPSFFKVELIYRSADDLPRLIHHLGPRYTGGFQDLELVKFLTYEASTSLNMYLGSTTQSQGAHMRSPQATTGSIKGKQSLTPIVKALREGMPSVGVKDDALLFVVAPDEFGAGAEGDTGSKRMGKDSVGVELGLRGVGKGSSGKGSVDAALSGDVYVVQAESLDVALWKIGGAAVGMRLVQLASVCHLPQGSPGPYADDGHIQTAHELSRTLGILTDGLKNSWQNSEDMERLRVYSSP